MPTNLKVKLSLAALCLLAIGASQIYLRGMDDGMASTDRQAFDAYTHFAKQMQHEAHHVKPAKTAQAYAVSVWSAVDNH
jgi:hypothetical protein